MLVIISIRHLMTLYVWYLPNNGEALSLQMKKM